MAINYLKMIWSVKILLAEIKDGKGKDFKFPDKKNLPRKILSRIDETTRFSGSSGH
jgi:hypothetical protein